MRPPIVTLGTALEEEGGAIRSCDGETFQSGSDKLLASLATIAAVKKKVLEGLSGE